MRRAHAYVWAQRNLRITNEEEFYVQKDAFVHTESNTLVMNSAVVY